MEPEKNNSKKSALSRRSRYYGDFIDVQLLNSGVDYEKLPELVTIFILPFDPFGENAMYYEAGTIVKTHPHVPYDDGIRRIYLYVNGDLPDNAADDDRQLQVLLKYINDSTTENATDELTKRLNGIVKSTKAKRDIGIRYMKSWERERELKEEGREEWELTKKVSQKCKFLIEQNRYFLSVIMHPDQFRWQQEGHGVVRSLF